LEIEEEEMIISQVLEMEAKAVHKRNELLVALLSSRVM
jgi:hypothetical protein